MLITASSLLSRHHMTSIYCVYPKVATATWLSPASSTQGMYRRFLNIETDELLWHSCTAPASFGGKSPAGAMREAACLSSLVGQVSSSLPLKNALSVRQIVRDWSEIGGTCSLLQEKSQEKTSLFLPKYLSSSLLLLMPWENSP